MKPIGPTSTIALTAEVWEALRVAAADRGVTRAALIREILAAWLAASELRLVNALANPRHDPIGDFLGARRFDLAVGDLAQDPPRTLDRERHRYGAQDREIGEGGGGSGARTPVDPREPRRGDVMSILRDLRRQIRGNRQEFVQHRREARWQRVMLRRWSRPPKHQRHNHPLSPEALAIAPALR